jgi:hypothetical protein
LLHSRVCARSEEAEIPPEILAAVSAGDVELTTKLLASAPESMSKAQKKKLQKNAEIAAKKIAKGGAAAPSPKPATADASSAGAAPAKEAAPAKAAAKVEKAKPPPPVPTGSDEGVAGANELELVTALLATAESLGLAEDALAKLRGNQAMLALSLSPYVCALRNEAYATGFNAHGSRAS